MASVNMIPTRYPNAKFQAPSKGKVVRVAVFLSAFCCVISTAPAYAQMTEQQKRRAILPSVRAATDCIAREALAHPNIVAGWRGNNILPMVDAAWKSCGSELVQLANAHDQLHGAGTGVTFVTGAYLADLGRAVASRIKDEMGRRVAAADQADAAQRAEQARIEAERQQNTERLERAALALRDRIYQCTGRELQNLVASAEGADVLATAAMTICRSEIDDAIEARMSAVRAAIGAGYSRANEPQRREELRKTVRESVLTEAVQLKASSQQRQSQPVPATGNPAPPLAAADGVSKELRACLQSVSTVRNGSFVNQQKLYETMLDLCRPEIETAARSDFLAAPNGSLAEAREKALTKAAALAKTLAGIRD